MRICESCARCLYDRQQNQTNDAEYLAKIREILDNRGENDTSPYMVYLFNKVHEGYFGAKADYSELKKQYNDLVLGMEAKLRQKIEQSKDPLAEAMVMARIGNYIDFGAMNEVDRETFFALFDDTRMRKDDLLVYESFLHACETGKKFLLVCDNCGEIVLDRLFIEQLKKRFSHLEVSVLVRGGEVLNDATKEDAQYTGMDRVAKIVSNGEAIAGTIYEMMPKEAREALDEADVILAKGQGNYESMCEQGRHVFYAFLCKCDLFTKRFHVPKLTGIFMEEQDVKVRQME